MEERIPQKPLPCSSSSLNPAGAMSTRQEARREGGDSKKGGQEAELRDRAHLSQQRRLKQATQFLHKDSADLLPLDSLKRLGTSKDLVRQPSPLPTPMEVLWPFLSTSPPCTLSIGVRTDPKPSDSQSSLRVGERQSHKLEGLPLTIHSS